VYPNEIKARKESKKYYFKIKSLRRDIFNLGAGIGSAFLYSPDLLTDIYSRIKPEISEGGTSATFFWLNVVNMLLSSSHRRSHYPLRRLNYAILRCLSITHLQQAKSILRSREKTTSQDSQSAIRLLDQVQRFLEWQAIN